MAAGVDSLTGSLRRLHGAGLLLCHGASRGVLVDARHRLEALCARLGRKVVPFGQAGNNRGCVIIEALDEASPAARQTRLGRLNQNRDALAALDHVLVLLVLESELSWMAATAPDLWSVRSALVGHTVLPPEPGPRSKAPTLRDDCPIPASLATLCERFSLVGLQLEDTEGRNLPRLSLSRLYQSLRAAGPPPAERAAIRAPTGEVTEVLIRYRVALLAGAAGSGKTTALKDFAKRLARAGHAVVFLPLTNTTVPADAIRDPAATLSALAGKCPWSPAPQEQPWLLLDGLDEVTDRDQRRRILLAVDDTSRLGLVAGAVISGRPEAFYALDTEPAGGSQQVEPARTLPLVRLQPFDDEQIRAYLAAWVDLAVEQAERAAQLATLHRTLGLGAGARSGRARRIAELCSRPLFLAAVAALVRRRGVEPESEYEVLHALVDALIHRRKEGQARGLSPTDLRQLAGEAAWILHEQQAFVLPESEVLSRSSILGTDTLTALRIATGLLAERPGEVRFAHTALQEVLVAEQAIDRVGWGDHGRLSDFVWGRDALLLPRPGTHPDFSGDEPWHARTGLVLRTPHTGILALDRMATLAPNNIARFLEHEFGEARRYEAVPIPFGHVVDVLAEGWGARPPLMLRGLHESIRSALWHLNRRPVNPHAWLTGPVTAKDLARLGDTRLGMTEFVVIEHGWELARWPVSRRLYATFIEEGGYRDNRWWAPEGRKWKDSAASSRSKRSPERWGFPGFDEPWQPVVGLSRHEAQAFVAWVRETQDPRACLPSKALWLAAARAGPGFDKSLSVRGRMSIPVPIGAAVTQATAQGVEDLGGLVRQWLAPEGAVKEHWAGWAFCDDPMPLRDAYADWTGRGGRRWYHPFGLRLAREPMRS